MITGRATVAIVRVVVPGAVPESVTVRGKKVGVVEVTIDGDVVWLGVMTAL